MIHLKLKKLDENAVIPRYSKPGDAAMDLTAISKVVEFHYIEYGTGLAIEVPEGHVALLFSRSSVTNKGMFLGNGVGVIDSGYRGELKFRYYLNEIFSEEYNIGDRIGQMIIVPYPTVTIEEVQELSSSERGIGGYGSTGK